MYRTARAHPPSRCQVSFLLTLQLAPDLTGTRCACLLPCLLRSPGTPVHTYTRTHILHRLRLESFPTVGRGTEIENGFPHAPHRSGWVLPEATDY